MAEYPENFRGSQQRDLVLASNEFCFLQSKTDGMIKTYTGPITMTISAQETLVTFDTRTKQFKQTNDFNEAKQLFVSAPENWYIVLKNPAKSLGHPEIGKAVIAPELEVGKKINIAGPTTFSLYPGQMARVIQGHRLRSNQYLLARVYDAEAASSSDSTTIDADGKTVKDTTKYFSGQLLVIKGTDVSFYIPPTGIEVIPSEDGDYVRDAVTLERLEYCILKDENGTKRYIHGPKVVFPAPTETFVSRRKEGYIFKAIELSPISGVYVKVIAEYKDKDGATHPVGEELFITGKDQMIYYPRPEHAMISYDNKIMHHAIAIPKGEGRYVLNRLTGEIKTVKGPAMYLPDPRKEVVVKRKLSPNQCKLWYPGNREVLEYNESLSEKSVEKSLKSSDAAYINAVATSASYSIGGTSFSNVATLADIEANGSVSRGTSYTKPRTITLDNKYDGVVSIDVWTGFAVNIISKNGDRQVVLGPQTILLDYDQTLDILNLSTGKPKTTDYLETTVFLRYKNNKISDIVEVETKDFVKASIKISYCVDFLEKDKDRWFAVDNYVKFMCDKQRALMKRVAKKYTIEEFYQNYNEIIRNIAIDAKAEKTSLKDGEKQAAAGRYFKENGMLVYDAEVLSFHIEESYADLMDAHQREIVEKTIELSSIDKTMEVTRQLIKSDEEKAKLHYDAKIYKMELQRQEAEKKMTVEEEIARKKEAEKLAQKQAEADLQDVIDIVEAAKRNRVEEERKAQLAHEEALAKIEEAKQKAYAQTIADIMKSVSPELVAAMETKSNAELTKAIAQSLSPYALAGGNESAADVVNKLLRGTSLEDVVTGVNVNVD